MLRVKPVGLSFKNNYKQTNVKSGQKSYFANASDTFTPSFTSAAKALPDLRQAINKSMTGVFNKTTSKSQIQVFLKKGRVTRVLNKSIDNTTTLSRMGENGKIKLKKIHYADGSIETTKYDRKGNILTQRVELPEINIDHYYDVNGDRIKSIEADKKGVIINTTDYYYHDDGNYREIIERDPFGNMSVERYAKNGLTTEVEGVIKDKRVVKTFYNASSKENFPIHEVETINNKLFLFKDFYLDANLKTLEAKYKGLIFRKKYLFNGDLSKVEREFEGKLYTEYYEKEKVDNKDYFKVVRGVLQTEEGFTYHISFDEEQNVSKIIGENGENINEEALEKWLGGFAEQENYIGKYIDDDFERALGEYEVESFDKKLATIGKTPPHLKEIKDPTSIKEIKFIKKNKLLESEIKNKIEGMNNLFNS